MAKDTKLSHDELQRDELAEGLLGAWAWVRQRRELVIGSILAVVVLIAGIGIWGGIRARANANANQLITQAMSSYAQYQSATDPKDREQSAQKTMETLDNLIKAYGDTRLGREGRFLKGSFLYSQDKFADAQKAYDEYLKAAESGGSSAEKARGEIALGYAYENETFWLTDNSARENSLKAARTHYDRAVAIAPAKSYLQYYAMLGQARVAELTGQDQQAIEIYDRIVKERPAPPSLVSSKPQDQAEASSKKDKLTEMVRDEVISREGQMSFQATAKLRLERLRAKAPLVAPETTVTTVTP